MAHPHGSARVDVVVQDARTSSQLLVNAEGVVSEGKAVQVILWIGERVMSAYKSRGGQRHVVVEMVLQP